MSRFTVDLLDGRNPGERQIGDRSRAEISGKRRRHPESACATHVVEEEGLLLIGVIELAESGWTASNENLQRWWWSRQDVKACRPSE
jgi:hypothetical protein